MKPAKPIAWLLTASMAAAAVWTSGCELVVGNGNYSTGDDGGGGASSSSGGTTTSSGSSSGGSSSGATSVATAFAALTGKTLAFTEDFEGCTISDADGPSSATDGLTVVATSSDMITVTTSLASTSMGCTFMLTTSQDSTNYVASGTDQTCAVTDTSNGVTTTTTFSTMQVTLPIAGGSATLAATGTAEVTQDGEVVTTCSDVTSNGTVD
jgi:hypothetical protein